MIRTSLLGWVLPALVAGSLLAGTAESPVLIYPQLAIGGGFQVVLVVTNANDTPFDGYLLLPEFGPESGRRWSLNGEDRTGSDRAPLSLPPLATRRLVLSAPDGAAAAAGSLQIGALGASSVHNLALSFFYKYSVGGELVDSIGVPSAAPAYHTTVPVERLPQDRVNTGVAIRVRADPAAGPAASPEDPVYVLALRDENGVLLAEAFGSFQGARYFDEFFADTLPSAIPFTGSLRIESETPFYLVVLRQQLLGGDRFQLTGIPPWSPADDQPAASFSARYRVTFQADWSALTHPMDFPAGAHFSSLIGGTHNSGANFWEPGSLATEGVERMAELGATSTLASEVEFEIFRGTAGAVLRGGNIARSPGRVELEFEIDRRHPLVTLVSMIAPSPDWFVGVGSLELFRNGGWADEVVVELHPYDAGTDSGATFESPDLDTQPPDPIQPITGAPFLNQGVVQPMGTFTFQRIG